MNHWTSTQNRLTWTGPRPQNLGRVLALSATDRDELEAAAIDRQQRAIAASVREALTTALSAIEALPEPPLGWPTLGHDRDTTLDLLREMLPTRDEE